MNVCEHFGIHIVHFQLLEFIQCFHCMLLRNLFFGYVISSCNFCLLLLCFVLELLTGRFFLTLLFCALLKLLMCFSYALFVLHISALPVYERAMCSTDKWHLKMKNIIICIC